MRTARLRVATLSTASRAWLDSSSTRSAASTRISTPSSCPISRSSFVVKAVYAGPRRPRMCTSVIRFPARPSSTSSGMSVSESCSADLISTRATSRATLPTPTTTAEVVVAISCSTTGASRPASLSRAPGARRPGSGGRRVPAVPGHQLRRGDTARQALTRDLHPPVAAGTVRVDHRVDRVPELGHRQVATDGHVAVEADAGLLQGALEGVADGADRGVVRRDAVAHQPEGHRQPVDDGDLDRHVVLLDQRLGGVDAGGAGADDRDDQRTAVDRPSGHAQPTTPLVVAPGSSSRVRHRSGGWLARPTREG